MSVAAAILFMATAAKAQTVVDGGTIEYQGVVVHLWGIDAPAKGQVRADNWNAGQAAMNHLAVLMRGRKVVRDLKGADVAPRVTALCTADGKDLGAEMASAGLAWALMRESEDYIVRETKAMSAIRGVHAHPCLKVREWRKKQLGKP